MSQFIQNANWRYATKKFDATKKVSAEDLATLQEAIKLTASSYGLQPYKVIIVENSDLRAQLQPVSWGQSQIVDASYLFVFANNVNFGEADIDNYFANVVATRNLAMEDLQGYADFMKSKVLTLPEHTKNSWTAKQTYLALGNLLNAAADLKIDVTPIEGFEPEKYNEILGLDKLGLNATVVAAIGYRHEEDATQHYPKVRKSNEDLFVTL
ncbi:NAD(P)H-dependent oxidoreductase [Flavobacterium sp.]|uniref:NAD(P)H-dependent oxidoreductase n=1 Tax=Flavobacterium sp. TaxID=239 RepID=UPI00262C7005|nr:NAD(P)H-dependent oxidoreductase [Flavobacterium sp.]